MPKQVLITGAANGLGLALAKIYFAKGCHLHLWDINQTALEKLKSNFGPKVFIYGFDIADENELKKNVDLTLKNSFGGIDLVIANAGVGGVNPGDHFSEQVNRKIFEVNTLGAINTIMSFIPSMIRAKKGQIVAISSLASLRGLPSGASYSASKAALNNFVESIAMDLAPYQIVTTLILPGFIKTKMLDHDEFPTPFTVTIEKAAKACTSAIERKKAVYLFPWHMKILALFNRILPAPVHRWLLPRLNQTKSQKAQIF